MPGAIGALRVAVGPAPRRRATVAHAVAIGRADDQHRNAPRRALQRLDAPGEPRGITLEIEVVVKPLVGAEGENDHAFVVPAKGDIDFDMMIKANMALALLKLGNKMDQHADSIDYDVSGAASIDLPLLRDLPFHQTGSFPLKGLQ